MADSGPPARVARVRTDSGTIPTFKIVLTGGPCGGKSTSMVRLKNFLAARGFRVFVVREAAGQ